MTSPRLASTLLSLGLTACAGARPLLVSDSCSDALRAPGLHEQTWAAIVRVSTETGSGSGFVLRPTETSNLVVTNLHVVEGYDRAQIHLGSGQAIAARLVAASTEDDLALFELPAALDIETLSLNQRPPELGQEILVLGFPGVRGSSFTLTAERGAITTLERDLGGHRYLQTNANINPGNSGGPALDACGAVIGVVVAKVTTTDGTNLLVPVDRLIRLVSQHLQGETHSPARARGALVAFLELLERGEPVTAASHLSSHFVRGTLSAYYERRLGALDRKLELARRIHPAASAEALSSTLSASERALLGLYEMERRGDISPLQARRMVFVLYAEELLREVASVHLTGLDVDVDTARARVELRPPRGRARTVLVRLEPEPGRWSIRDIRAP